MYLYIYISNASTSHQLRRSRASFTQAESVRTLQTARPPASLASSAVPSWAAQVACGLPRLPTRLAATEFRVVQRKPWLCSVLLWGGGLAVNTQPISALLRLAFVLGKPCRGHCSGWCCAQEPRGHRKDFIRHPPEPLNSQQAPSREGWLNDEPGAPANPFCRNLPAAAASLFDQQASAPRLRNQLRTMLTSENQSQSRDS